MKLAMITARGGSKRIPGKNYKEFCGKPILLYSIEAALESGVFDEVMVSTDDDHIAGIAETAGAKVPFRRSAKTSDDYATTDEVIAEVLETYEERGIHYDSFCCIYPTAPFLTAERLQEAMKLLEEHESVLPVVGFSYPPQRGFIVGAETKTVLRWMPQFEHTRSQDLEKIYHDAGQFYCLRADEYMRCGGKVTEKIVPFEISELEVQDIDNEADWRLAELKYQFLHGLDKRG